MDDPKPDELSFTDRLPDEGSRPFEAFLAYRDLGPNRSLDAVAKRLSKSLAIVGRWSSDYSWQARVRAFENHLERVRCEARCRATAQEAVADARLWERRKRASLEKFYEASERLRKVGTRMLGVAVTRLVEVDGLSELEAVGNWRTVDASRLLKVACEIQSVVLEAATRPFESMSTAELEAVAGTDVAGADPGESGDGDPPAA